MTDDGLGVDGSTAAGALRLSARDLTFGYGAKPLLRGIDMEAGAGECVALLGANGAGKTTLLRLLGGLVTPDAGDVLLGSASLTSLTAAERVRHVGYLPQRTPRPTGFAVFEIVLMGLYATLPARGWEGYREMRAVGRALRRARAARLLRRPFDDLSGGEQRRVLLARALVARPDFLLLDEPLAALDPGFVRELTATLAQLKSGGVGLVVATHRLSLVREIADRVIVLREGERLADGDVESTLQPPILDAAYDTDWFSSHAEETA